MAKKQEPMHKQDGYTAYTKCFRLAGQPGAVNVSRYWERYPRAAVSCQNCLRTKGKRWQEG